MNLPFSVFVNLLVFAKDCLFIKKNIKIEEKSSKIIVSV